MSESCSYVLYCDISDFYNQVYHHTVENQLAESGFPNQAIKWTIGLLESTTQGVSRGIPIGPHGAHLIAECSLIPIDNSLRANGVNFIRFADDFVIFCESIDAARKTLNIVATTLDKQQRLTLQRHKTRIFAADEFREHCSRMIEDRPINGEEEEILKVIKRYSGGNPYATVTFNQIAPEDLRAFSEEIIQRIIREYLHEDEIDYIRLRWFFRRLAQVGHYGALRIIIENIGSLEPCLPSVCAYISSVREIPSNEWKDIGDALLDVLESESQLDTEFARLSILSLFSRNEHIDHFVRLAQRFGLGDVNMRREILLAAKTNSETDWLRDHKESFNVMDPWQRMAFIFCMAIFPRDEKRFFLQSAEPSCEFERQLIRWSRR